MAAATIAGFMALAPAPARASGAGLPTFDGIGVPLLATSGVAFGTLDIVFISIGRPLPIGISILQIGVGGLLVPLIAGLDSSRTEVHVAAYASAIWFTAHGIYDLARYPEYRRQRLRERELERERRCMELSSPCAPQEAPEPIYGASVAPLAQGGVTLQLYARL